MLIRRIPLANHAAVYGQKLHSLVAQKIAESVAAGIVDTAEVKHSLNYYVNNFLREERHYLRTKHFIPPMMTYETMWERLSGH